MTLVKYGKKITVKESICMCEVGHLDLLRGKEGSGVRGEKAGHSSERHRAE